jgi:site-specific DNA recombinase
VLYARVSSEEQRENLTIEPQIAMYKQWVDLQNQAGHSHESIGIYEDNGVSGTIPFAQRPAGSRLIEEVHAELADLVIVTRVDRLGRDTVDIITATRDLYERSLPVKSLSEDYDLSTPAGRFMFHMLAAQAGFIRDSMTERSIEASTHWAKNGVWLGGIIPYGYMVEGKKKEARLVISTRMIPGLNMTEADVVRLIYRLLVEDRWSTIRIAEHLNSLGVPTAYTRDQRKTKKRGEPDDTKVATVGIWRYGTVGRIITNPVYKGEYQYGRRSKRGREVIIAHVPALVSGETWEQAQIALKENQRFPRRDKAQHYLLRGLITCGVCGLNYHGTETPRRHKAESDVYYVCNGKLPFWRRTRGQCTNNMVRADLLEEAIWSDILHYINNPGEIFQQLTEQYERRQGQTSDFKQEQATAELALKQKADERDRILSLYRRRIITDADLESQYAQIAQEEGALEARLRVLTTTLSGHTAITNRLLAAQSLLERLREEMQGEVTWEKKRATIEQLVLKITIYPIDPTTPKSREVHVNYIFDDGGARRCSLNTTHTPDGILPRYSLARSRTSSVAIGCTR